MLKVEGVKSVQISLYSDDKVSGQKIYLVRMH